MPTSPRPTPDTTLWLCLHFANLPLEVFVRDSQMPVVVTERGHVYRLNRPAERMGIERGASMSTALYISESVSSFERDPAKECSALDRLAQWAYRFTPDVSIQPPDSLLLDIARCLELWGGVDALQDRIREGLPILGFEPTIGLGRTPLAAHLAALGNLQGDFETSRIALLCVETDIIESLERMGIRTIGQLLEFPTSSLSRRFGTDFTDYLQRLTGDKPDPREFITAEPYFDAGITFLTDVTDSNALLFPINRLLTELGEFLAGRQLCTSHLTWQLCHRSHEPVTFGISLAEPESDPAVFMPLTQLKLDKLESVREVDSVSLSVNEFMPANAEAGDLFHGTRFTSRDGHIGSTADKARANALINMLGARLGQERCFGLSIADDHRPEKAWRRIRTSEMSVRRMEPDAGLGPRPAFLLTTPKPLRAVEGVPAIGGKLTLMKGPERIDFGWWDRHDIFEPLARDYYVARDPGGALYWVFEYPAGMSSARWYLHGIFS